MAHEAFLPFGRNWKQTAAALVHRLMTMILLRAADVVWISIPEWEERFKPYALHRPVPFQWLPIPSNIPVIENPGAVNTIRRRYVSGDRIMIGHFGTHGWPITSVLEPILSMLGNGPEAPDILLMGGGSEEFRTELIRRRPGLGGLIHAAGLLRAEELSYHVAACDLLIQPYPDGVSSRRGSLMVGLVHGKPIVSTYGPLSSSFWRDTEAIALAPAGDAMAFAGLVQQLAGDPDKRRRMSLAARALYDERFALSHTIAALRGAGSLEYSGCPS